LGLIAAIIRHTKFKVNILLKVESMRKVISVVLAVAAAVSVPAIAESVEERIKPVGSVCMAGDDCAAGSVQLAAADGPRSGEQVYKKACTTCHAAGIAGAPKLGDVAAWAPRVAKGMDVLYKSSISGLNGMPAKGMCFDCSDDELKASVDYMIENSK